MDMHSTFWHGALESTLSSTQCPRQALGLCLLAPASVGLAAAVGAGGLKPSPWRKLRPQVPHNAFLSYKNKSVGSSFSGAGCCGWGRCAEAFPLVEAAALFCGW